MTVPFKICLLANNLAGGGAERVSVNLANGLTRKGVHVDIVVTNAEDVYSHLLIGKNIINLHSQRPLIGSLLTIFRFISYLYKAKPDAIISGIESIHYMAIICCWFYAPSIPLLAIIHTTLSSHWHDSPLDWKQRIKRALSRMMLARHHLIVAVSQASARDTEKYLGLSQGSVYTIYNPVVDEALVRRAREWAPPPAPLGKPVILAVGALKPLKNFTLLLHAFARVHSQMPCRLVILGEGEERPALETLARSLQIVADVSLPGFVHDPYAHMLEAAAFVLSSNHEGLPGALIEALACGCPVVSTDCPSGPREILEDGAYGTLVPVGNVQALAKAIMDVLQAPHTAAERDLRIRRANDFSVENATDSYLQLLGLS